MDPNETLTALREALEAYGEDEREGLGEFDPLDLVQPLESLMSWLDGGGFLPRDWARTYCPDADEIVRTLDDGLTCSWCDGRHPVA